MSSKPYLPALVPFAPIAPLTKAQKERMRIQEPIYFARMTHSEIQGVVTSIRVAEFVLS